MTDLLGLIGATIIFTCSSLFERVRAIYPKFLGCALCVGFWVGVGGAVARYKEPIDIFFTGTTVSLLSFTTFLVLVRLQGK